MKSRIEERLNRDLIEDAQSEYPNKPVLNFAHALLQSQKL